MLMILIHATAYFLDEPTSLLIWNTTHFAVPLFVFCSAYILLQRNDAKSLSIVRAVSRLKRLVVPYIIFTTVLLVTFVLVLDRPISLQSAIRWYLLGSGRDIGWLVVLFIYFIFLIPLILRVAKYTQLKRVVYVVVWVAPIAFLFTPHFQSFRLIMWLPWSAFLIFAYWFVKNEQNRWFPFCTLGVAVVALLLSRFILIEMEKTLVFTENKYPPNMYYLSYGILTTTILYYLHHFLTTHNLFAHWLQQIFNFFSRHSYSLFFIHFIYVYLLKDMIDYKVLGWMGFFGVILILSVITQFGVNKIQLIVKRIIPHLGMIPKSN